MRELRASHLIGGLLLSLTLGPAPAWAAGPAAKSAVGGSPVAGIATVLITHPTPRVLNDFVNLITAGILPLQGTHLIGIYHVNENEDYAPARAFLADRKIDWIDLRPVTCAIDIDHMYDNPNCAREFAQLFRDSDGIIFNGGDDIPPAIYHRRTLLTTHIRTPLRHMFEISLLYHLIGGADVASRPPLLALRPNYPIFGICVGMQSINIAAGGTLIQDIPSQLYHLTDLESGPAQLPKSAWHRSWDYQMSPVDFGAMGVMHPLRATAEAPVAWQPLLGGDDPAQVLSVHHQAIDQLGTGLKVLATSMDGRVVEGIGHRRYPNVVGVQFHPELVYLWGLPPLPALSSINSCSGDDHFAYEVLRREPQTRAFNRLIWRDFAAAVIGTQEARNFSATLPPKAP